MHGSFLQSPEWERINKEVGRITWRAMGQLIIRYDLPHGFNYLYCPRPEFTAENMQGFFAEVSRIAHTQKSLFLKIDPIHELSFEGIHARIQEVNPLQPRHTLILDLTKSEEELLAAMHEKTRYNIRLAERKQIEVAQVIRRERNEDFETFWRLLSETAKRGGFHLHDKRYYELLSRVRTTAMSNEFFFAYMRDDHDTVLAAAMINFSCDSTNGSLTATYLHGASSSHHRDMMAPFLLHWRIIQEAKHRSAVQYDLWGIDEKRWPGVTRFKTGFGGTRIDYPVSVNVIYRQVFYRIYKLMSGRTSAHNVADS